MHDVAIRVEKLSKRYHIGRKLDRYRTLRDVLTEAVRSPVRRWRQHRTNRAVSQDETFWALKEVSFEVNRGDVVGLIGRNGAGKSTLLKILSRITEPTSGFAEIHGRIGALLEVGTGFHPELTGRENIYLNGAILGMRRGEIDRKFDEMVAFAAVEKFIDTPVKHYSTGMRLRLAFAVAAHLEPEILLVDEVLAVGDASFQRKCLNKMEEVGHGGRTVIFVSHNMPAITRLCKRAILLEDGQVLHDGPAHQVVSAYLNSGLGTTAAREWPDPTKAPTGELARLRAVRVRDVNGEVSDSVDIRQPVRLEMEYEVLKPGHVMFSHFQLFNEEGVHLFGAVDLDPQWRRRPRPAGRWVSTVWIPGNFLAEGTVFVGAGVTSTDPTVDQFEEMDLVAFQVIDSLDGDSARGDYGGHMYGVVRPLLKWQTELRSP